MCAELVDLRKQLKTDQGQELDSTSFAFEAASMTSG
jgi:hypothetical protein